ncbi:PREDICTED: casein kinase II subunit beta-2-like [Nelumbo nucifera]|uniref:Casein kinase II subunit beta n=1 Tax=Nelumbo nucifera TaxID=4432 RepID=A0A1U7ZE43_NELNU|nr:PREDICTED: casein kinase II subunit beta-2-like [Nelumbo nucifera]
MQNKLQHLVGQQLDVLENLPPKVRKCVEVLRGIQLANTESEETELSSSNGEESSWISWCCGLKGNELLCEVDEDYIQDDFNLCALQGQVPYYDQTLFLALGIFLSLGKHFTGESEIESAVELLYGLIHACYILTSKGLNAMHEKYKRVDVGRSPRIVCAGQPYLPVGTSDIPCNGSVKICTYLGANIKELLFDGQIWHH